MSWCYVFAVGADFVSRSGEDDEEEEDDEDFSYDPEQYFFGMAGQGGGGDGGEGEGEGLHDDDVNRIAGETSCLLRLCTFSIFVLTLHVCGRYDGERSGAQ